MEVCIRLVNYSTYPLTGYRIFFKKILILKKITFKKIATMHGKGEISKIKRTFYNFLIEASNIRNILPRLEFSEGSIFLKLKLGSQVQGSCTFPTNSFTYYTLRDYLKLYNKFYEDTSFARGLSGDDIFMFSNIFKIQG